MSVSSTQIPEDSKIEDVALWGVEEVLIWIEQIIGNFGVENAGGEGKENAKDGPNLAKVQENFRENAIDGASLLELDLDDCKQLMENDAKFAVHLKLEINILRTQKGTQEDEILAVLSQLYSTVSDKLQDFQNQYSRLRLDVLEVVKKDSISVPQSQQLTAGSVPVSAHSHAPQQDYFEGHRVVTPSSPSNLTGRQPLNRSTSSTASQQNATTPAVSTPYSIPTLQPGNEPLKHMRASKEDSCERILKSAMKRHGLNEQDWRQYVLVICYGDQERILELDEKPVQIFKNLKQQGLHPAIMLRQRGDFEEVNNGLTPGGRL